MSTIGWGDADTRQEESIFNEPVRKASLVDDIRLSRTRTYTTAIELLRLLHNSLVKVIESWESFENGEIQYFEVNEQETHRRGWGSYFAAIEKNMTELRFLRRLLQQRIEMFDNMRNGVWYDITATLMNLLT